MTIDKDGLASLLERLEDEAQRLSGHSLDRGSLDAGIGANLASEAASVLAAQQEEIERLQSDLAAQIAGHRETARQSTENLIRANTAQARIDDAEGRARKHWQAFRDLRTEIIGGGPMCRDCADENGRCPHSGRPCDPDEAVKEQLAAWKASSRSRALKEAR